jgi:hypothetical protein
MTDEEVFTDEDRVELNRLAEILVHEHAEEWRAVAEAYRDSVRGRRSPPSASVLRRIEALLHQDFGVLTDLEAYWEIWEEPGELQPSPGGGYEIACATADNDLEIRFGITPSRWWLGVVVPYPEHLASMSDRFWSHLCGLNKYGNAFALYGAPAAIEKVSLAVPSMIDAFRRRLEPMPPPVSLGVEWPIDIAWSAFEEPAAKALRILVTLGRRVDMRERPRGTSNLLPRLRLVK